MVLSLHFWKKWPLSTFPPLIINPYGPGQLAFGSSSWGAPTLKIDASILYLQKPNNVYTYVCAISCVAIVILANTPLSLHTAVPYSAPPFVSTWQAPPTNANPPVHSVFEFVIRTAKSCLTSQGRCWYIQFLKRPRVRLCSVLPSIPLAFSINGCASVDWVLYIEIESKKCFRLSMFLHSLLIDYWL